LGITTLPNVTGKVVRLDENGKGGQVKPGDILVTRMTTPRMVGQMIQASAIVTEIGGELCHAAIVARELKKPCVVGCPQAYLLKTGDIITVNPTEGIVDLVKG
jgi:pyruvate, water dikinase